MKTVAITTLGCKTNQFESAAMHEALAGEGYSMVPFDESADVYIINTCTVTAKTDAESRKLIRRAVRLNPAAQIVVTGCYAQIAPEELKELPGVSLIMGNAEKKGIVGLLRELSDTPQVLVSDISLESDGGVVSLETFAEHTRAFLQIQTGCDAFCSYCIVPHARGRSRSVPFEDALKGIATFSAQGFREVVLTGIHLGGYGLDLEQGRTLLDLLKAVEELNLVQRLRIGSVEPLEIPEEMVSYFASSRILCPHMHIPLQSGDNHVLGLMNRRYSTGYYRDLMQRLVEAIPGICLGTDIIAGFPGESEREFENTYHFLDSLPLAYLHVFPFSPREGTPAATMPDHIHPAVIRERAKALRRLSELKRRAYYRSFLGKELLILIQGKNEDGMLTGLSRNYIPVLLAGDETLVNTEVAVEVTEVVREKVIGRVV
ncbi:MAG: tRNA (N(6)-L-threonylcarbamoyladenosine(37)-C(2))-methylthiotransferase MtaB [Geobacter sp.]|nr:tRNA (N(6)-L-threonylcarbamoyladenosine(37)-C(2))-methylthiotransferase MtaB [Geobacter sp.]